LKQISLTSFIRNFLCPKSQSAKALLGCLLILGHYKQGTRDLKTIRLYRNPECVRCASLARMHHRFDWLNRFEDTTEIPSTGPLNIGEIAVQNLASGETLKGVECFKLLCTQIPAYWLLLLLFPLPAFRRYIEREVGGCDGAACEFPNAPGAGVAQQVTSSDRPADASQHQGSD
jgi:hypothetical protein